MADKMLIDATHPEETRVVVLRGNRVEEFDFESANRKQLRGNIYLAKVTRVEPSLQAAFVDYGGNRHGFLAFSEIHPDYYQIPVADRQALLAQEERDQRAADADDDRRASRRGGRNRNHRRGAERPRDMVRSEPVAGEEQPPVETSPGEAALGGLPPEQSPEPELPTSEPAPAELEAQAEAQDEAREAYESPMGDIEPPAPPAAEPRRRRIIRRAEVRTGAGGRRGSCGGRRPSRPRGRSCRRTRAGRNRSVDRRRIAPPRTAPATTTTRMNRLNRSAAPTPWKKRRSACRASAASTRFKR